MTFSYTLCELSAILRDSFDAVDPGYYLLIGTVS